jgi:hypothetical protein
MQLTIHDISAKWTVVLAHVIRFFYKVEIRLRITCKLTNQYVKLSKFKKSSHTSFILELISTFLKVQHIMLFFKISSNKNKERDRFFLAPGGVRLLAVSIVLLV